jgi:hypothetical protein
MKALVVGIAVNIQFVRIERAEIFMAPGEVAHIWSAPVHLLLQHPIIGVGSVGRRLLEELGAENELIPMFSGRLDGFLGRDLTLVEGMARHPGTGFLAPIFFIVLELDPVDKAVVIPMIVHEFEERFPVNGFQLIRTEALAKGLVIPL